MVILNRQGKYPVANNISLAWQRLCLCLSTMEVNRVWEWKHLGPKTMSVSFKIIQRRIKNSLPTARFMDHPE